MGTQREQLTAIRDMATSASNGNEAAFQSLYGIGFGSLTREQADGLRIGLNFSLSNLTFVEEA
jgi:hypothetical protein